MFRLKRNIFLLIYPVIISPLNTRQALFSSLTIANISVISFFSHLVKKIKRKRIKHLPRQKPCSAFKSWSFSLQSVAVSNAHSSDSQGEHRCSNLLLKVYSRFRELRESHNKGFNNSSIYCSFRNFFASMPVTKLSGHADRVR